MKNQQRCFFLWLHRKSWPDHFLFTLPFSFPRIVLNFSLLQIPHHLYSFLGSSSPPPSSSSSFFSLLGYSIASSVHFSSVQSLSRVRLCNTMDCSMLQEHAQTHVHQVGDAIQPSHSLSSPSPPTFNLSQQQCLFQRVSSLHQVTKVLELQHQSFHWTFRTDLL